MDRDRESIRNEAFELEPASQVLLVEELVEHLAETPHMQAWLNESESRLDAYHKGQLGSVSLQESLARIDRLMSK
jgi:hypothetical protein